jgi:hypothetical protein
MGFIPLCKTRPALNCMDKDSHCGRSAIFVFDALCLYLIPNEVLVPEGSLPSGFLVPGMLVYFIAMAAIGAPLCIGFIVGILLGMNRGQH